MPAMGSKSMHRVAIMCSVMAVAVALTVLTAWCVGWVRIIQPIPDGGIMQFNTALCLLFLGISGLLIFSDFRRAALLCAIVPAAISVLVLAEYIFAIDLGPDQVFLKAYVTHPTCPPGRMGSNTAVCMLLGSLIVISLVRVERSVRTLLFTQALSLAIFFTALCALIGHGLALKPLYGWYGLTHMAPHTAMGLVLISSIFLQYGGSRLRQLGHDIWSYLPWMALSTGLVITVALWQMVLADRIGKWEAVIQVEVQELASHIAFQWDHQVLAIDRHGSRWDIAGGLDEARWRRDAMAHVRDFNGLSALAYFADESQAVWVERAPWLSIDTFSTLVASGDVTAAHERARDLGGTQLTPAFRDDGGAWFVLTVTPATQGPDEHGFILGLIDITRMLGGALASSEVDRFELHLWDQGQEIYSLGTGNVDLMAALRAPVPATVAHIDWVVEAVPTYKSFVETQSKLAEVILFLGLLATGALVWSLRERGKALLLAAEIAESNRALAAEMDVRSEVQARLAEREEHVRTLLQSTAEAIYGVDLHGICTFCNAACVRMLGYETESDLLGKNMHTLIHHTRPDGGTYPEDECHICRSFRNNIPVHVDTEKFWKADGSAIPVEYWAHPVERHGVVSGAVVAFLDIGLRKAAEEELRASEERFDLAVRGANDGIWDWDIGRGTAWYSDGYKGMLGYVGEEEFPHVFESFSGAIHQEERGSILTAVREHLDAYVPFDVECRLRRKDGTYGWFHVRGTCIRDAAGTPYRMAGSLQDVSERRKLMEELSRLNAALLEQTRDLEQRNQEVEAFVYIVSHDLRAPLVNIQGFCNELQWSCDELSEFARNVDLPSESLSRLQSIVDDDIPGALRFITAGTAKFERLINALLRLSRTGRQVYTFEPLDMESLAQETVDMLQGTIDEKGATVQLEPMPEAFGDRTAVGQVLGNLIGNALNYLKTEGGGEIVVGGGPSPEYGGTCYWVRDNGQGIPEASMERIFQVFQRVHASHCEGEGMGLAIVKRIVERHGGTIWVESRVGLGSTFYFNLSGDVGAGKHPVAVENRTDE